jgi:hypothetical protein
MVRGQRSETRRQENRPRKSPEKGSLALVKKKREYDFETGRLKVKNLTRFQLKNWDDFLSQGSEEEGTIVKNKARSEVVMVENNMIVAEEVQEEPTVSLNFTQCLDTSINLNGPSLGDDSTEFPYAIYDLQMPDPSHIVEEEKQIFSNLERKRTEALQKLNKKREDRIESNRLMALYRLSLKQTEGIEQDSKSVYLTQEQIKRINQSKIQALQKRQMKMKMNGHR